MSTNQEYANFLDDTSWYTHTNEGNAPELMYLTLGLAGESGEFADAVKKIIRSCGAHNDEAFGELMLEAGGQDKLTDELGDVLWYLVKLASFLGFTLEQLMHKNTYKLHERLRLRTNYTTIPWPFTDPSLSQATAATESFNREVFDVRVDQKV